VRFNSLKLKAFGHFTDYLLDFEADRGFHFVYGPNEAGKSTILRGVTNLLYGFPNQTPDSFLHDNAQLRIEGAVEDSLGNEIHFIRRKGRTNTILDLNGNPMEESVLSTFLNGLNQEHFLTMFGLDHVRLREGGQSLLQSGGTVGESLFSAASGISGIRSIMKQLDEEARRLYKKSGSNPKINSAIRDYKEASKKASELTLAAQIWKRLERDYYDGNKAISELKQEIKEHSIRKEKLERMGRTLPLLAQRKKLLEDIDSLGTAPELPESARDERIRLTQKREQAEKAKRKAEETKIRLSSELEIITLPRELMKQETVITELYRQVDQYHENKELLPKREGSLAHARQSAAAMLKELDPDAKELTSVEKFRLSIEKKETIKTLSGQYPLLLQEKRTIEETVEETTTLLDELKQQLNTLGEVRDGKRLYEVLDNVKREGNLEADLSTKEKEFQQLRDEIEADIQHLPIWTGTIEECVTLPVPSLHESIKKFHNNWNQSHANINLVKNKILTEMEKQEESKERLNEIDSLGDIPTETKLKEVRSSRNKGWQIIRCVLTGEEYDQTLIKSFASDEPLYTVYERSVVRADEVADHMRLEAEKVGEKKKHLADLKKSEANLRKLDEEKEMIQMQLEKWEDDWAKLWEPTGITPLTPEEMKEWLQNHQAIKRKISEVNQLKESIAETRNRINAYSNSIRNELTELNECAIDHDSLENLLKSSEAVYDRLQTKQNKHENLLEDERELSEKQRNTTKKKDEITHRLNDWYNDWEKALEGLDISIETPQKVVIEILSKYEQCLEQFDTIKIVESEVKQLEDKIKTFEERTKELVQASALDFNDGPAGTVINSIYERVNQAKQDVVSIKRIEDQLTEVKDTTAEADANCNEYNGKLRELMDKAKCTDLSELEEVEKRSHHKRDLGQKLDNIEQQLLENGSGLTVAELAQETAGIDRDSLSIEKAEVEKVLNDFDQRRSDQEQRYGAIKKEYDERVQGNSIAAVEAAEEQESILAELREKANEYVTLKLASILLAKGIEYYRSKNQNPIIQRASEIFAQVTLQSFAEATIDFDEQDNPILIGVRADGEKVPLEGMSDGTQDQLYLSLRLASIEKYVEENEPIPFIVDDIFIHFDDERSRETLKVLAQLSKKTQVIFFTHHQRLLDLAQQAVPAAELDIHEINKQEKALQ
jgi:uncharacterized protein YhaN